MSLAGKPKTKAKQRYLKAKKDRRKARKAAGPKPAGERSKKQPWEQHEEQQSDEDDGDDDVSVRGDADTPEDAGALPETSAASQNERQEEQTSEPAATTTYLYRFPRPQQTASDDATDHLASQGIPDALLHPTEVAASKTQALDTPDDQLLHLCPETRRQLAELGITQWFAVQATVIPALLHDPRMRHTYLPYTPPHDLCISAPTGSGKTLAYIVPIMELLRTRTIVQLRALILVPTRDLAVQVRDVFEAVAKGSGLRAATITGHHSFRHEQEQLLHADVVMATPGRLVDHIRGTPGFTLEHLRFLVIDEADRLLGQSFQEWVSTLLDALEPHGPSDRLCAPPRLWTESDTWARDDIQVPQPSVQKLLFSATLSRDPAKISALRLRDPQFIRVRDGAEQGQFALPSSLHQHMLICPTNEKVLHLLHMLHGDQRIRQALCFTKSVDAANRLVHLLLFFQEAWAQATAQPPLHIHFYSSDLRTSERKQLLRAFERGEVDVLVCSDLIARGIDLPDVRHVISYDVPVDTAKYVHRVGRTARAGRVGDAWSLVEEQEVYHFKRMLNEAGQLEHIQRHKVHSGAFDPLLPHYKAALARLAQLYSQQR